MPLSFPAGPLVALLAPLAAGGPFAAAAAPAATAADPDSVSACAVLAREALVLPHAAADVRATLAQHGRAVRWDVAHGPLDVWIQPRAAAVGDGRGARDWYGAVFDAAESWRDVVPGLAFRVVGDSAGAAVVVTWVGVLPPPPGAAGLTGWGAAGRTALQPAAGGRAAAAHVRLAVATPAGATYSLADARAVARHELGHVLGLGHLAADSSVMSPLVRVDRVTAADRAALRLLYALPIGARCPAT